VLSVFEYQVMRQVKCYLAMISRYQLHMSRLFVFRHEACMILLHVWLVLKPFLQLLKSVKCLMTCTAQVPFDLTSMVTA